MTIWQDIRYAVRSLRRSPALVVLAIVSLSFGVGANTLAFGTLRALVLRPLPIHDPERVFFVEAPQTSTSYLNYIDLRDGGNEAIDLAAYRIEPIGVDAGAGARYVWVTLATGNYFGMLGASPAAGRFFTPSEDVGLDQAPYVVLSHAFWLSQFAGDPSAVGRVIRVTGKPFTVIGVAPPGFYGTEVFVRPDIWVPMTMARQVEGTTWIQNRGAQNVYVAGRLRSGVTREQAEARLRVIGADIAARYPAFAADAPTRLVPPGLLGDVLRRPVVTFMTGILALSILVLFAACANLATLLAARVVDRLRELAVRLSLGATRALILRQLIVETLVLCLLGGIVGLGVGAALLAALSRWRPSVFLPIAFDLRPDASVIVFALTACLLSAVLAVTAAARRAWRTEPNTLLRGEAERRRWMTRDILLGVQITLCSLLVVSTLVAFADSTARSRHRSDSILTTCTSPHSTST